MDPHFIHRESFADGFNNKEMSDILLKIKLPKDEFEEFEHRSKRIKVDDKQNQIYASKLFLCSQSSYFRSMFKSGFKEKNQTEISIELENQELADSFQELLSFLHKGEFTNTSNERLLTILKLAGQFDFSMAALAASQLLSQKQLDLKFVCKCLANHIRFVGLNNSTKPLQQACIDFLEKKFEDFDETWNTDDFKSLNHYSLEVILKSDKIRVYSENTVYQAFRKWLNFKQKRIKHISLLKYIKFHHMSYQYLFYLLETEKNMKETPFFLKMICMGLSYRSASGKCKETISECLQLSPPRPINTLKEVTKITLTAHISKTMTLSPIFSLHGFPVRVAVQVKDGYVGSFLYRDPTVLLLQLKATIYAKDQKTGEWILRAELLLHFSKKDGESAWGSKSIIPTSDTRFIKDEKVEIQSCLKLCD